MLIRVTQENINEGTPKQHLSCPIALAYNDNDIAANVNSRNTYFPLSGISSVKHDYHIINFIYRFDHGDGVRPFWFEMKNGKARKIGGIELLVKWSLVEIYKIMERIENAD